MQKGKLKHSTSADKHGGSNIMAPACMAANGTMSLVFTDDLTADRSSRKFPFSKLLFMILGKKKICKLNLTLQSFFVL